MALPVCQKGSTAWPRALYRTCPSRSLLLLVALKAQKLRDVSKFSLPLSLAVLAAIEMCSRCAVFAGVVVGSRKGGVCLGR